MANSLEIIKIHKSSVQEECRMEIHEFLIPKVLRGEEFSAQWGQIRSLFGAPV